MKPSKQRVLWLPKWYPNKLDVLDGVFIVDHAKAAARVCDLCLLFVHSDLNLKKRVEVERTTSKGFLEYKVYFRHKSLGVGPLDKLIIAVKYTLVQFWFYAKIRKEWGRADITHVHCLARSSLLVLYLKFVRKTPFFVTEHWSGFDPDSNYKISVFKKFYIRQLLKYSSGVTTVSNYLKQHLKSFVSSSKLSVISNAVDDKVFQLKVKKGNMSKVKLIHISTLDDYPKNFGNILKSLALVVEKNQNFELKVYGKGEEEFKQKKLAAKLGLLNKYVFFMSFANKEKIAREIASSDCLLLFSYFETQSCVVLESLMCGVPVIVPKLGGVQELVTEANGIKVPPLNNVEFARAILAFLEGDFVFNNTTIRKDALKYAYENIGEEFNKLYSKVDL